MCTQSVLQLWQTPPARAKSQDRVSPVFVYDGVEELSISPVGGEVVAAQTLVSLHHPLGPKQQLLFGRHVVRLAVHLNVGNLREETVQRVSNIGCKLSPLQSFLRSRCTFFLAKFGLIIYHNIQTEILDFECVFFLIYIGQMLAKIQV